MKQLRSVLKMACLVLPVASFPASAAQIWFDIGDEQYVILGTTLTSIQEAAASQSADTIGNVLNECEGTGWFARALSSTGIIYGVSCGAGSRADAVSIASEQCEGVGGTDCSTYSITSGYDDGTNIADFNITYTGSDAETIGAAQ